MMIRQAVQQHLEEHHLGELVDISSVAGGCINEAFRIKTSQGLELFCKTHQSPPSGMFAAESVSLEAIANNSSFFIPNIYAVDEHFLLLSYISSALPSNQYWEDFGIYLAQLHRHHSLKFGFSIDNYCGLTPQPNKQMTDGHQFFAEQRLLYQGRLALNAGRLANGHFRQLEKFCQKLDQLIPRQPASLIHGDLWSGNAFIGPNGEPALIDPAAYYGWAESELAMTRLFGGFPENFYRSYESASGIAPDWRERINYYNLYHLLNHLNLFGEGYLSQVLSIIKPF